MSSLYLHIPFCINKCPYCDFFSQVGTPQQLDDYVDLLLLNIPVLKTSYPQHQPFTTIYFGGGTPSLLPARQIDRILNEIENHFGIQENAEITLEANPGTVSQQQLSDFRKTGVNRLSIGVQSLNDDNLKILGRQHDAQQAYNSVDMSRQAGFDNLSLDLIFALPQQSLSDLESELSNLLRLNSEHISIYGLSFEDGTEFERLKQIGSLSESSEELYTDQYRLIDDRLAAAGYEHYEISNFAKPDLRCQHNQNYWKRDSCLAVGIGAHGFSTEAWGRRWYIEPSLDNYKNNLVQGNNPATTLETFDRHQAMQEYFYLGLRTSDGINRKTFEKHFNCQAETVFSDAFKQISSALKSDQQRWYFDLESWLIYDHLISAFL